MCLQVQTGTEVLSRGLAAAHGRERKDRRRRSLLSAGSIDANEAYSRLSDSTAGLTALISASTAVGTAKVSGSSSICLAVARTDASVQAVGSSTVISMECASTASNAATAKSLLGTAAASATVTMPAALAAECAASSTHNQDGLATSQFTYYGDAGLN